jgi:acetyl esterase/lipase
VGISGQYRLGAREGTPPADCVADAKSAVRYLRSHAAELGIDPQKIAVGGESAGAHIAACAGTLPAYNDPKDDLSISCVPDALLLYYPFAMVTPFGNRKDDMSPLHFVTPSTPPTLLVAGEMDGIAPAQRGIDWGNQMKGSANPFRLFIYRKAHHPSGNHDFTKPGIDNDMIRQTDIFLVSLGYLSGQPTVPPMDAEAIAKLHVDPKDFKPIPPKPAPARPAASAGSNS